MAQNNSNQGMSEDTKSIVTVLLLIFIYPVGLILMFFWVKWPIWVKLIVGLPVTIVLISILSLMVFSAKVKNSYYSTISTPSAQIISPTPTPTLK